MITPNLIGGGPDFPSALCAQTDPAAWFPEYGENSRAAKAMCARCIHRIECLTYALDNREPFGIWGGTSELDRKKIRRAAA